MIAADIAVPCESTPAASDTLLDSLGNARKDYEKAVSKI